jgi:hypothetical protein
VVEQAVAEVRDACSNLFYSWSVPDCSTESLRNFARDTVPEGTFSALQEDVYQSVIDISESSYQDGLARMRATVAQSAQLPLTSSPLASVTRPQDKQGICHQLANEERLTWVPKK